MKLKRFDVVELKDNNRAIILEEKNNNQYFVEVVNSYGITLGNKIISNNEIEKIIYPIEKKL